LAGAYILDIACSPLLGRAAPATDLAGVLLDAVRRAATSAQVRLTDVHDVVVGHTAGDGGAGDLLDRLNNAEAVSDGVTAYLVDRGAASGLHALGLAAQGVLSGQQDVIVATAGSLGGSAGLASPVHPATPGVDPADVERHVKASATRAGRALAEGALSHFGLADATTVGVAELPAAPGGPAFATAIIVSERFAERFHRPPKARIRRMTTAASYVRTSAEAMSEAAIRLLMNETLNVGDVDLWEIHDGDVAAAIETGSMLDVDVDRVNAGGGVAAFGDAGSATCLRSTAIALCLLRQRKLHTCGVLAPAPGSTAAALLIERL